MFTWIWVFLLCSWKIKTLFLKLEDQKLQTMQLFSALLYNIAPGTDIQTALRRD